MELATHWREGTWSCEVELARCQGTELQLAGNRSVTGLRPQDTARQAIALYGYTAACPKSVYKYRTKITLTQTP